MRAKESARAVAGSIIVYVVMAACSSKGGGGFLGRGGGGPGVDADGGDPNGSADTGLDGLLDPVPTAAAEVYKSGSRLKAKYYEGQDGSKAFVGWFDSQRNEDCSFRIAADGTARCLPTGDVVQFFNDGNCTSPLVMVAKPCATAAAYAVFQDGVSCSEVRTRVYPRGNPTTPGGTIFMKASTSCTGISSSTYQTIYNFFTVGPEVAPSAFVGANLKVEP